MRQVRHGVYKLTSREGGLLFYCNACHREARLAEKILHKPFCSVATRLAARPDIIEVKEPT